VIPATLAELRAAAKMDPAFELLLLDVEDRVEAAFRAGAAADRERVREHVTSQSFLSPTASSRVT
jgi:hypothetical protein